MNNIIQDALSILIRQRRFDLIFKYLYAKCPSGYNRYAYLEHIRAFNNFYELNPSDNKPKNSAEDFINSFNVLIGNLKLNGYSNEKDAIPLGINGEIQDGAHRLATCAALNIPARLEHDVNKSDSIYDYRFFLNRGMDQAVMDYGALEYVKLNPNAYIVNLHSITDPKFDDKVEAILNKYGIIYYKRAIKLTYNGLVNLKKMSYGLLWDRETWIGTPANKYAGAQDHAKASLGKNCTRIYVFICNDIQKVIKAKKEIRDIYGIGNYSVHINDIHEEAVWLAETYFNANSLFSINNRPFYKEDELFDHNINYLKKTIEGLGIQTDDVCAAGSTPLNQLLIRHSDDIDYFSVDDNFNLEDNIISPHDSQLKYYPYAKEDIIYNPANYGYYRGMKIISLDVLYKMKWKRGEYKKDYQDCAAILRLRFLNYFDFFLNQHQHNRLIEKYSVLKQKMKRIIRRKN